MSEARPVILIAQADGAAALSPLLIEQGYRVEHSRDAHSLVTDAVRLTPALVVLEDGLPDADSFALCTRLREQGSTSILLLLASDADDDTIERAYRSGATDVLLKPIRKTILIRRVRSLIDAQPDSQVDQRRWQQAFERSRAIQLIVNPQTGQIVDANPAACAFYGYPREEFRQRLIGDLDVSGASEEGASTLFNFRHRLASGQVREVKIFSNPLEYDGKALLYLIIFALTSRSEAGESELLATALRNTAAALSSTLDQNELIDVILEQVNVVVPSESANVMLIEAGIARVVRSRGYDSQGKEALINEMRLKVSETPSLSWMVENNRAIAIPNTATYEGWQAFDATAVWLKSYVAAPIRIGNYVIGFLNIDSSIPNRFSAADADHLQIFADQAAIAIRNARLFDRVRRQAAEMERRVIERTAELEYERGQMRGILDAMTEGVAYTEHDNGVFRVRYVNQALVQMMGYSPDEWIDQALHLFRSQDQSDEEFNRLLAESTASLLSVGYWHNEPRLVRKDGSEFDAVTITTAVVMPGSSTTGAVTVVRDVSKEKALQQQKARFVAYASHELRTPITNLITRLYLMRRQPERLDEHMHVLDHVANRMKRLVEDLLDISRFERGVITLDFQDVILQDVIQMLVLVQQPEAERKGLQIASRLTETPLHVRADAERLGQVITNLITNAINYTPGGGRIEVRLTEDCQEHGSVARVEVEDSGIGITEEHLPHIFQPFYRVVSQIEGTGLGLSITQEIVELHGGEITVSSQIGVGSIFCFWLPLIEPPDTPDTPVSAMNTPLERAEAFIQAGELEDALAALDEHLQAQPDHGDARHLRASVLLRLPGRARDALADLDLLADPSAEDDLLRYALLDAAGDQDAAFAHAETMWTRHHDLRSAEIYLRLLYRRGEIERALSLLADQPKTWTWLGWGGDFYALRGDDSIAVEHYCSALDQLDHVEPNALIEIQRAALLLKRAHACQRLRLFADADLDYRAAEAIIPNDPTIPFQRGLLVFEQGDLPGALSLCQHALDRAPAYLRDHMRKMLDEPRYQTLAQGL